MKKISSIIIVACLTLLVVSCDALHSVSSKSVTSQGSPYELIVVCNQPEWEGELGEALRATFSAQIPYLQQEEPMFDVLRVTESGYTNLVTKHRNIFRVSINPEIAQTAASVEYNVNATPQIVVTLVSSSEQEATAYVEEHREQIRSVFEGAERDRSIDYAQKFGVASLSRIIKDKFLFDMNIPVGYTLRNEGDDFVWISYEFPTSSQGALIYSYPAVEGVKDLSLDALVAARNKYASKIPGPSDGSYMITVKEFTPQYRTFRLDGRLWVELRGLWEVEGDFMGGPFVSYSTINTQTGEIVTIDGYVYSPKLGKRNLLRGLDHLLYNASFE